MKNILPLILAVPFIMISSIRSGYAIDFGQDDSGKVKISMSSFFNDDDKGDSERSATRDVNYDPEDADYKVDIIGRKVPVKTRKAGTAIETR